MRTPYQFFKSLFRKRRLEKDLQDELLSHLKMDEEERIRLGDSPEEARYNARRDFGSVARSAEDVRQTWAGATIDRLGLDLRYTIRQIERNPGFVAFATLTLGLGIGANTAIFSVIDAVLLKPLPYKNPDRLVQIVENI